MTRSQLVVEMATAAGWTRPVADRALRSMLAAIRASLRRGDPVTLVGFGTFSATRRLPRTMRNPRTGKTVRVAGRIPRFKPSPELKGAVR
jgi:nucleoid DNA-binding protein